MKYFNKTMTADDVRMRLYDLLYIHKVPESEIATVKKEHKEMCKITVEREQKLAGDGWLTE